MKAHIGVYNVHDSHLLPKLLHDHEAKAEHPFVVLKVTF
jgi:hypothetical protein